MRPKNLKTKIFLDSGDPNETKIALKKLGFLDGQTTNPTLIAKNPKAIKRLESGKKFTKKEIYTFYKRVVEQISDIIPKGSVSIEVYADLDTTARDLLIEARLMNSWIDNAHIKLPITKNGLLAANEAIKEDINVNMTLCFSQEQALAVHGATMGIKKGSVFVSPFIGRLDDIGFDGLSLISNILKNYREEKSSVEVLAASVRNLSHLVSVIEMESDIVTAPLSVLLEWANEGFPVTVKSKKTTNSLKKINYNSRISLKDWKKMNIEHDLTRKGIERFCSDWKALIA